MRQPVELPKDLSFRLPPGLVGNPNAVRAVHDGRLLRARGRNRTSARRAPWWASRLSPPTNPKRCKVFTKTVPVFNLVPAQGEPARFGLEVIGKIPVVIDTSVRSGQDYGVDASVEDATETAGLLSSQVTLWGVPGDPRHDNARGWECVAGGVFAAQVGKPCPATSELPEQPFLTLPTSCAADPQAEPVLFSMEADSWAAPGSFLGAEYAWMNEAGQSARLRRVQRTAVHAGDQRDTRTARGEHADGSDGGCEGAAAEHAEAGGRAEADVRDTTVTLPQGVQLNPSAANGLEAARRPRSALRASTRARRPTNSTPPNQPCPDSIEGRHGANQDAAAERMNLKAPPTWPRRRPTGKRDRTRSTRWSRCISSPKTRSRACWSSSRAKGA